jgi:hypothetical protein
VIPCSNLISLGEEPMLLENTKPQTRVLAGRVILPGMNKIDDSDWDSLLKSGQWGKPIKGLLEDEVLIAHDARQKITIAMVNKTFDPAILNEWLESAKGPLKGAILKQLDALELEKDL